jgi:hypothetical protein
LQIEELRDLGIGEFQISDFLLQQMAAQRTDGAA